MWQASFESRQGGPTTCGSEHAAHTPGGLFSPVGNPPPPPPSVLISRGAGRTTVTAQLASGATRWASPGIRLASFGGSVGGQPTDQLETCRVGPTQTGVHRARAHGRRSWVRVRTSVDPRPCPGAFWISGSGPGCRMPLSSARTPQHWPSRKPLAWPIGRRCAAAVCHLRRGCPVKCVHRIY